jgi:hypothetical protein
VNLSPFAGTTAFGQTLKDKGVYRQLAYAYDMNSLVSGGLKRGTIPTGELSFGTIRRELQQKYPGVTFYSLPADMITDALTG